MYLLNLDVFVKQPEIFRHKTSHMVLSIIFLEGKHKILLHLSILYEYQQFFQHRICLSTPTGNFSDVFFILDKKVILAMYSYLGQE
jgi:hypothetical protein